MITYSFLATIVFLIMSSMYRYALKKKDEPELNKIEFHDAESSLYSMILMGSIPFLALMIAVIFSNYMLGGIISGFTYMFYIPVMITFGVIRNKSRLKLFKFFN